MRIIVVSDSHAPRHWKGVPRALDEALPGADLILHAGDVCDARVLEQLGAYAPVKAVLGTNDDESVRAWGAPDALEFEVEGVNLAMVHDSGAKAGRGARMRRRFPTADLVVFGHSHIPMDVVESGVHLFNPGSVTEPRRQPRPSYGLILIEDGSVTTRVLTYPREGIKDIVRPLSPRPGSPDRR